MVYGQVRQQQVIAGREVAGPLTHGPAGTAGRVAGPARETLASKGENEEEEEEAGMAGDHGVYQPPTLGRAKLCKTCVGSMSDEPFRDLIDSCNL